MSRPTPEWKSANVPEAGRAARIGRVTGVLLFIAILALPAPAGLEPAAWRTAAVAALMAAWWFTEAIPIPATALVPVVLFPLLGVGTIRETAEPYANPIIFLFLGGFLLAAAMQRWNLHRRIAFGIVRRTGTRPSGLMAGFMVATALLSMWVSNTATAVMMMPIGLSVVGVLSAAESESAEGAGEDLHGGLAVALLLGIAYAASIGGLGTLVGTPPNAFLAAYMKETYGIDVGFARWMLVGLPLVAVALPAAWWLLTRVIFRVGDAEIPGAARALRREEAGLGAIRPAERRVAAVFLLTGLLWVTRPLLERFLPGLSDAGIAMTGGLSLFLLPSGEPGRPLLDWEDARHVPWGVLILFGGGLSLATAIDRTGLSVRIGEAAAGIASWPTPVFALLVTASIIMLTEVTSNAATTATVLPVLAAVSVQAGIDPLPIAVSAALAASCAFMLPVATPPNAIAYASGRVRVADMTRAGLWLNVLMIVLVTLWATFVVPLVFGS